MKKFFILVSFVSWGCLNAQLTSSLTACYALNGNASDPISNLNGTLAAVTATTDRNNNAGAAYSFTGSPASKITLPNDPKLKANELSFSAWVKPLNTGSSQYMVFAKNQVSSNFEAYALNYDGISKFTVTKGNNGTVASVVGTTTISANSWHHVAFTFDNATIKLYVNGVLDGTTASTLTVGYDAAKNVILGGSAESFNLPYNGLMDNVRFYNRAINGSEVALLYTQDPSCVTTITVTPTNLEAQTLWRNMKLYPNPTQGKLTIDLPTGLNGTSKLQDLLGNILLEIRNDEDEIDLSNYPNGIYFIVMELEGEKLVKKVIKE